MVDLLHAAEADLGSGEHTQGPRRYTRKASIDRIAKTRKLAPIGTKSHRHPQEEARVSLGF